MTQRPSDAELAVLLAGCAAIITGYRNENSGAKWQQLDAARGELLTAADALEASADTFGQKVERARIALADEHEQQGGGPMPMTYQACAVIALRAALTPNAGGTDAAK